MEIDEIDYPESWISISAIRSAAEMKSAVKPSFHRKTASSPPETPSNFKLIHVSGFSLNKSQHVRYNTLSGDTPLQVKIPSTDKKHSQIIPRLNEEIMILSTQLNQANQIIMQLTKKLSESNNKHAIHLQALQERHEKKAKKSKQELDFFLNEIQNKSLVNIEKKFKAEAIQQEQRFQEAFSSQNKAFQDEIEKNNYEHEKEVLLIKDHCIKIICNLKQIFIEEMEKIEKRNKKNIIRLCKKYNIVKKEAEALSEPEDISLIEAENESSEEEFQVSAEFETKINTSFKQYKEDYPEFESYIAFSTN